MSRGTEKPSVNPHLLDAVEPLVRFKNLTRLAVGSPYPDYVQFAWKRQPQIDVSQFSDQQWVVKPEGDPEATRIPLARLWRRAVILATSKIELEEIKPEDQRVHHAMAYVTGKTVRVGWINEQPELFTPIDGEDGQYVGMAGRLSHGFYQGSIGLWMPEEGRLALPKQVFAYNDEPIDIARLADGFPGMKLA